MPNKIRKFIPVIILLLISIYSLYPLLRYPLDTIIAAHEDLLMIWIINQTIEKIPYNIVDIFQGNIFYPYKNVLSFSDLLIPQALINFIPVKIINEPVVAFNISIFLGQFISMVVVYLFWRDITNNSTSSLIASIVFGLSTIRFNYQVHLQTWIIYWWVMAFWMIWKFYKEKKLKYLYISAIFIIIQIWESILPIMWIFFYALLLSINNRKWFKKNIFNQIIVALVIFLFTFPVINSYLYVSGVHNYVRSIRETAHFSMNLDDIWKINLSPGLYALLFGSFVKLIHVGTKNIKKHIWIFMTLGFAIIMSLGPVLKWAGNTLKISDIPIPLPYAFAYYVIPGMKALRSPSRWILLAAFAASGIIAYAFKDLTIKKNKYLIGLLFVIAIFGGDRITETVKIERFNQYPDYVKHLKTLEESVILELPIYGWSMKNGPRIEMKRMLYSLYHKKNRVNGYSGYFPEEWTKLVLVLNNSFPDKSTEIKLKDIGVGYIVVHKNEYKKEQLSKIFAWGKDKIIWQNNEIVIYQLI